MTTDYIADLRDRHKYHTQIADAIADALNLIEQSPVAALRAACAHYDTGHDPDVVALTAALAAACEGL